MSQLMKKRMENERQRMNGLNDPLKPSPTANAQTMNCNSWAAMNSEIPSPSQQSQMKPSLSFYQKPRPRDKEISIESLLQQSCLHEKRQQAKPKQIPNWNAPDMSDLSCYENFEALKVDARDNTLPAGAYFEAPMYVDEQGNPMTFKPPQALTEMDCCPVQPLTSSNAPAELPQSSRCTDANCSDCKSSVSAK